MKPTRNQGFTIVELVIVIAVIAILAAVMIPTFSGVVSEARESAVLQTARDSYREALAIAISDDGMITPSDGEITAYGITWKCLDTGELEAADSFKGYTITVLNNGANIILTAVEDPQS